MVGRPGQYQFSWNTGELAPAVWGNTGLKQFYAGAAQMLNVEPVPQGGFRLMARSRFRATLPLVYDPTDPDQAAVRCFDFTYERDTGAYVIVLTPGTATIFKSGVQVAQIGTPYNASNLPVLKRVQRQDTMFLFHQNKPTGRILRNGSDTSWSFDAPGFTNIPQVQLDGVYTNTVVEVWVLTFTYPSIVGGFNPASVAFVISINNIETNSVTLTGGDVSAAIAAAINQLPTVDPTIVVTNFGSTDASDTYLITFAGGTNAGANFLVGGRVVNTTQASVTTYRSTTGVPGGEPLFSSTAGYAACGRFYQDRLTLGGFRSTPASFLLSQTGEYFNMNIRVPSSPSSAILLKLDTDGSETIVDMVESKHLVLLTTEADYYVADRALSASAAPNLVQSSTNGCSTRVDAVKQEAGVIYVNRDETIVMAATYDAVSEAYVSSPLSLLSSHLVVGTRDAALQKSYKATDGEHYWLVRDDGLLVVGVLIRNQDVTGFVRWQTDGLIQAVAVDGDNLVHIVVLRQVNGLPQLFLETLDDALWLDAALDVTNAPAAAHVTGLGIHEGATVWAIADGFVEGPFTVVGGAITLSQPASLITVGRWTAPLAETLPLVRDVAAHTTLKRPARVHTVMLDLLATTSVAIGANEQPAKDVKLLTVTQPTDTPPLPFTGEIKEPGLTGWSPEGQVVITQVRPGALQVRDLVAEAKI